MNRNEAINQLLAHASITELQNATQQHAQQQPHNYLVQLFNTSFNPAFADFTNSWFTAYGLLCIYQHRLAGRILQQANLASGHPVLKAAAKKQILDAVAAGSKLTKADAG